MADTNAPKPSDTKRDGVTTDPQSGSPTGASSSSVGTAGKVSSPSQPAGSRPGTGDAGSERNLNVARDAQDGTNKLKVTNETRDVNTGVITRTLEDKGGNVMTISATNAEDADRHIERLSRVPTFTNERQSLDGTPGYTNLTQDGRLAGDKSVRDERDLEDINKEIDAKAGPNPLPNREGNEMARASNFMATAAGTAVLGRIDRDTTMLARELKDISKKDSLSADDKDRLEAISKQLDNTGRV